MRLDLCAFKIDGRSVPLAEVLAAARLAGLLDRLAASVREEVACAALAEDEALAVETDELQAALDEWRTERNLIAADETEVWLDRHGLALDDVVARLEGRLFRRRGIVLDHEAIHHDDSMATARADSHPVVDDDRALLVAARLE